MKKYICLLAVFLMGCTPGTGRITPGMGMRLELQEQTAEQLHLPVQQSGSPVVAAWLTAVSLSDMLKGATEAAYRAAVHQELTWLCENGFTDVFVQVRSNGDAYYRSRVYPRAASWSQDFDPFQVFLEENQQVGLQVHAWINPYRCQTAGQMLKIPDTYPTRMWAQEQAEPIVQVSGRWYLNPADAHAQALICTGAQELLDGYDIAGLHIDDYFYPTTDTAFDDDDYAAADTSLSLADWRRENVNALMTLCYQTAHQYGVRFGAAPVGDPDRSYAELIAEAKQRKVPRCMAMMGMCPHNGDVPPLNGGFLMSNPISHELTQADFFHALSLDIAMSIVLCIKRINALDAYDRDYVVGCGGGLRSELICQAIADLSGFKIQIFRGFDQATMMGCMYLCNDALGVPSQPRELIRTVEPHDNPELEAYFARWQKLRSVLTEMN